MWMPASPNNLTKCISAEPVSSQWANNLSAQLPKLIQRDLQHKEQEAFQVTWTAMFPLEKLVVLKNVILPKKAISLLWTNLQSTKHM